jgi:hypothetical protein
MTTALIAIVVVVALIAGIVLSLRKSAKTGMPSQDVLERATRRAREQDSRDSEQGKN